VAVLSFLFGGNELNVRRTRVLRLRFRLWSHCLVGRLGVRSSRFLLCRSDLRLTSTPINDKIDDIELEEGRPPTEASELLISGNERGAGDGTEMRLSWRF
jgi:hypothetical protein